MSNIRSDSGRHMRLIHEIERDYPQAETDPERYLAYLVERLISQSPEAALQLLREHGANGIQSLPTLQLLTAALADRLLDKQEPQLVEELLQLAIEWHFPFDATLPRKLAKAYRRQGNLAKAREVLDAALKQRATQSPDVVRDLYDIAKAENRTVEAHALLNRLIQADASLATVSFAYKERTALPPEAGRPVRIALLSSYTLDLLVPYLDYECRNVNLAPEFYIAPFNQYMQEVLQLSSDLYRFNPEIIFIALAIDDLYPDVRRYPSLEDLNKAGEETRERIRILVDGLREHTNAAIVLHEFVLMNRSPHGILDNKNPNGLGRWINDLNCKLEDDFRSQERAYLLPLGQVLGSIGKEQSHNPKMQYMASMRLSGAALPELARYSMRYVKPLKGLTRKCIVLDLDGTLWGGIAGELGIEGIQLGPSAPGVEYMDFQEALLNLTRRGILLAICSKNNLDDVLPILQNHPYMRLREEHFAATRINWRNKADNTREIAEELNIGIDSLVFFDDNPNERELIRQLLPEVLTVDLPTDPARYRATLEAMSDFELLALTKEDELRGAQYQAMQQRRAVHNAAGSLEAYLHSLDIKAGINFATAETLNRLVQMFNKTNQFNLTTRRYQAADMTRFIAAKEHRVYTLNVCDRFGDHGLVGAAIIHEEDCCWHIDSLLMSCRVMGLSVETAFLHKIYQDAVQAGIKSLMGEFIPTKQNQPVEDFYRNHGFTQMKEPDKRQFWELDVTTAKVERPAWVAITGASQHDDS